MSTTQHSKQLQRVFVLFIDGEVEGIFTAHDEAEFDATQNFAAGQYEIVSMPLETFETYEGEVAPTPTLFQQYRQTHNFKVDPS
jgi:hypothetical protein